MPSFTMNGLAGIDFGTLADAIIKLEREPIRQLETRQEELQSRQNMFTEIKSALESVKTAAEAIAKPDSLSFASATSGDTDRLTVSATSAAALGTYRVTIEQLATATRYTSGFATQLGASANVDLNANLNTSGSNLGHTFTDGYVTINGVQVTVNIDTSDATDPATNDTMQEVIDRINSTVSGVTASYDSATDKLKLASASAITVGSPDDTSNFLELTGLLASPDTLNGSTHERISTHRLGRLNTSAAMSTNTFGTALTATGSFTINGVTINYDASTQSLNEIISQINTSVSTVTASYDSQTDKIILSSKETGSTGITLADVSGNFLAATGLLTSGESQVAKTLGQNAKFTIDGFNGGQPMYSTTNSVTDAVSGLSLTLKQADAAQTVDVTVARDASDLKSKIQDFVSKYNDAISLIHTRLTEEPLDNPVSQTTRRVGLLRSDSLLAQVKTNLTSALTNLVSSLPTDYNRLGNLGVTISSSDYKTGTLTFDETTFNDTIEANFEQAYDILFDDADGDGTIDTGEVGVMPRFLDELDKIIDDTTQDYNGTSIPTGDIARRIWTLSRQESSLDTQIEDLEDRLFIRETALRRRFLAAEQAISQLQGSQNSLLALTLGQNSSLGRG